MTDTPDVTSYSDPEHIASAHESGMTFESAMEAVRNGHAVRREDWFEDIFVLEILYRDQPYLIRTVHRSRGGLRAFIPKTWEEDAEDWEIVEYPILWDRTLVTRDSHTRACGHELPRRFQPPPRKQGHTSKILGLTRNGLDTSDPATAPVRTRPHIEIYKRIPLTGGYEQPWSPTPEDVTATDWEVIPL